MTIRKKITLWYTAFMALFVVLALCLLFVIASGRILSDTRTRLKDTVLKSFAEIEYDDGVLTFDDDINYLGAGIYLSVYNADGALIYGRIPSSFSGASVLTMDRIQQVPFSGGVWYVYDFCQDIPGYGNLWVRGILSWSGMDDSLRTLLLFSLVLFPFFVLCTALGGYSIIRRALRPLSSMSETARQISGGNDLTRRIQLPPGADEVHSLARTFDQMMDRLQASFEQEKQFTSDVSHELRTPVAVILSQCEYASQNDVSEAERMEALSSIRSQAQRMSGLLSGLLTLARADQKRLPLHPERILLNDLAAIVCEEQQEFADAKKIRLHLQADSDLWMDADESMMIRLLINLISNSIRYGKEGGNVWIRLRQEENSILGSVEDDGIGIPEDQLDLIWNRFYQVDPSRSAKADASGSSAGPAGEGGYGLGLSMVRWIVDAHGGTISVASRPGEGTEFSFRFPRIPNRKEAP
ncbi:MAG TPA: HAMP domain-containing histidine kinase [Candidatus Eisenbergiella pullicola]|nr:HAMP domain-containing histidine kinase [Candidatus Eisenbergiella pullicola]